MRSNLRELSKIELEIVENGGETKKITDSTSEAIESIALKGSNLIEESKTES